MILLWCFSETAVFTEEKRSGLEAEDLVGNILDFDHLGTYLDDFLMRKNITQLLSSATFSHIFTW